MAASTSSEGSGSRRSNHKATKRLVVRKYDKRHGTMRMKVTASFSKVRHNLKLFDRSLVGNDDVYTLNDVHHE